ncbi:UNVERIFIED_CONTAM: hypothetical protein Slati_2183500 [Sesamum latifolium]|uniref:Zinc knuckle CX2CX4HX4C domain-containing protein n=1 Tax=Sesamum latifolium TaxID=2727402 RepID=A0AAW2WSX1_9LAMI
MLIMSSIEEHENPLNVDLDWCDFFVHIYDLPLSKMNFGVASLISNALGKFQDMEMEESGMSWGSSLRMRVAINVTQPLTRILRVCTTKGEDLLVSFTYERLQNFCYLCGCLGRILTYCEVRFELGFQDPGEVMPYGAWLRAPPDNWGSRSTGSRLRRLLFDDILHHIHLEVRRCLATLERTTVTQRLALVRANG